MMRATKKIKIEGDFIDSFIYSGTLFLVDTQLKLTSYAWHDLLNVTNCPSDLNLTLHQCFSNMRMQNIYNLDDSYTIYNNILNQHCCDELFLDSWPTDLDIYNNNFLISSNNGIQTFKFNRENSLSAKVKFENKVNTLWSNKVFELAVGNLDRLIISCGSMGAFELFTNSYSQYKLESEKQLNEEEWIGCEWDNSTGIAILKNQLKQELLKFENLDQEHLKVLTDQRDRNKYYKTIKEEDPIEYEIPNSTQKYINSWIFEDKVYLFSEDLDLYIYENNNLNKVSEIDKTQRPIGKIINSAKTHFGLVFEDMENLYVQNSDINILSNKVTNWRTYPKSKNYQNHIHFIEDDNLTIQIFE